MSKHNNKAILLLQMGGPSSLAHVEDFLFNLFNDPYIIQLPFFLKPFQKQLAKFISWRRAPRVAENYKMIGGASPILFETQCQARALEKRSSGEYKCYIAMRYSSPFLRETLEEMEHAGISELTVIPLYPQYSIATSGSSIIECQELFAASGFDKKCSIKYIESWGDNPYFIELISSRITDRLDDLLIKFKRQELSLQKQKDENPKSNIDTYINKKINLVFSAHGLPVSYITNGDPYLRQVEDSVNLIVQKLAEKLNLKIYKNLLKSTSLEIEWQTSFQSRVGPVKWLEPNTEDVLVELGDNGAKNIIIVPISFVGDHIETLHELGIEYAHVAREHGIENYLITRLPKANPLLIEAITSLVTNAVILSPRTGRKDPVIL